MEYIDRNKTFRTDGNEDIDHLLYFLDVTSILSEEYKTKIRTICLWLLTNHADHVEEIKKAIELRRYDLCGNIFSEIYGHRFI